MSASEKLCNVCGRRTAVYRRRDSGEKLCAYCLGRSLVRRIKRGISRSVRLKHKALVAILTLQERIVESLVLTEIVNSVERNYGGHVLVIVVDQTTPRIIRMNFTENVPIIYFHHRGAKEITPLGLLRMINSITPGLQNIGFRIDAVLTPLTLNDFFEAQLESLLAKAKLTEYITPLPSIIGQSVIVHPMSNILRQDVYAYAFFRGLFNNYYLREYALSHNYTLRRNCIDSVFKDISADFAEHHPELLFKFVETITSLMLMTVGQGKDRGLRVAQLNHH